MLTVALDAGRHVVIEGPPGTGKSTLLRDIARHAGKAVVFAEGNAELTPARLIGQYDPAQVLADGYVPAAFTDGPLLRAMQPSANAHSCSVIRPAATSASNLQMWVPEPTSWPRHLPDSIGPPVNMIAGMSTLAAPIRSASPR